LQRSELERLAQEAADAIVGRSLSPTNTLFYLRGLLGQVQLEHEREIHGIQLALRRIATRAEVSVACIHPDCSATRPAPMLFTDDTWEITTDGRWFCPGHRSPR
jgi:hypothetical protein